MEIVHDVPPMFEAINTKFHVEGKKVIFAWGKKIYNPMRMEVGPDLICHEAVHGLRQGDDPTLWWELYLRDESFRYQEELLAHRAEYQFLVAGERDRNRQAKLLNRTAARLGSPLYGWSRPHLEMIRDLKGPR